MTSSAPIGIIGGSGLYDLVGLEKVREEKVDTPFGSPSDALIHGQLGGVPLVFIPRHGRGHTLLPTEVPYRANIFAMKRAGVQFLISISAVGSMREDVHPGDVLLASQFIDRTRRHGTTFFGDGLVAHVSVADPVCHHLADTVAGAVRAAEVRCHPDGTYVCMEGPAFSTRAESLTYKQWQVDVIGMTAIPEMKLAREAELHYATVALVTDYDCWHDSEDNVSADAVLQTLRKNTANVKRILQLAIPEVAKIDHASLNCGCAEALRHAILTDPAAVSPEVRERLAPIVGKYLG